MTTANDYPVRKTCKAPKEQEDGTWLCTRDPGHDGEHQWACDGPDVPDHRQVKHCGRVFPNLQAAWLWAYEHNTLFKDGFLFLED